MENLKAIRPPLSEQNAIARYLDEKTAQVDQLIQQSEKIIALLREQRAATINHAVTKGLTHLPPEQGGTLGVPLYPSGVEWIGDVPEGWMVKKISWCFGYIGSGTTPKSDDDNFYENGTINWLQTGDLNNGEIFSTSKKITQLALNSVSSLKIFPVNSIVIAMYGATIGKLGILKIEATTNQACCVLSNPLGLYHRFTFYWLMSNQSNIISLGYGGGQPNISQDLIRSLRLPVPPLSQQNAIAQYLDEKTAEIDALARQEERRIELLREYRAALISEVVTGKVRVPETA